MDVDLTFGDADGLYEAVDHLVFQGTARIVKDHRGQTHVLLPLELSQEPTSLQGMVVT